MDNKCGKYLFLMLLILGLGFLLYYSQNQNATEGFDEENVSEENSNSGEVLEPGQIAVPSCGAPGPDNLAIIKEDEYLLPNDYSPPESDWMIGKFNHRNRAHGSFKPSSYSAGRRGALSSSEWQDYFEDNNNVIGNSLMGSNDKFLPVDESYNGYAAYQSGDRVKCGSNQDCDPQDLFDINKYLPQEVNDDWFEVQPEPISVKNRHLINITKPIGIDTIGSSNRNQSYDIRGAPQNPKFVVSPFLNSSIEPDNHLKPLM